nr:hypothetical protein CTRU02_09910 [Colletotrichum truncatum]
MGRVSERQLMMLEFHHQPSSLD